MKIVNLTNKRFGNLVVINLAGASRSGSKLWNCKCDCGNEIQVSTRHLNRKNNNIRSCGCLNPNRKIGKDSPYFKGFGEVSRLFFIKHVMHSVNRYKNRDLDVNVDEEYLNNLFKEQDGRCYYSGLPITLPTKWDDRTYTASVDRTDSSKGYIKGNVRFVHKYVNIMKNKFSEEFFLEMCKNITNNKIK